MARILTIFAIAFSFCGSSITATAKEQSAGRPIDPRAITVADAMSVYACSSTEPVEPKFLSEGAAISATQRARRSGSSLHVGRVRVDDVPWSEKADGRRFEYVGRLAGLPVDVLRVIAYEYEGVLLVDQESGDRVQADALPVANSDGNALVNLFGFDEPNPGVKVYERGPQRWRTYTIPAALPCRIRWIGPQRFQFTERIGPWDTRRERLVTVWRDETGWRRNPPALGGYR